MFCKSYNSCTKYSKGNTYFLMYKGIIIKKRSFRAIPCTAWFCAWNIYGEKPYLKRLQ
jgi:hypothetical protein